MNMFSPTVKMINSSLKIVYVENLPDPQVSKLIGNLIPVKEKCLPKELMGDKIRLKQILINLTKYVLKSSHNGQITIKAAYNDESKMLQVHIVNMGKVISPAKKESLLKALNLRTNDPH